LFEISCKAILLSLSYCLCIAYVSHMYRICSTFVCLWIEGKKMANHLFVCITKTLHILNLKKMFRFIFLLRLFLGKSFMKKASKSIYMLSCDISQMKCKYRSIWKFLEVLNPKTNVSNVCIYREIKVIKSPKYAIQVDWLYIRHSLLMIWSLFSFKPSVILIKFTLSWVERL
jgi:hypothetical protein